MAQLILQQDAGTVPAAPGPKRAPLACISCRKGKSKCVVSSGTRVCGECQRKEKECIWLDSNRGKWSRAAKRKRQDDEGTCPQELSGQYLQDTARTPASPVENSPHPSVSISSTCSGSRHNSTKHVIDVHNSLHRKVDNALFPFGLLAEVSRQIESSAADPEPRLANAQSQPHMVGVGNTKYFHDDISRQLLPQNYVKARPSILTEQIITTAQSEELFKLYFNLLNPQLGLLDPATTSPQSCSLRSAFLFTAICAVSSRFYRGGILYNVLLQHARRVGLDEMLTSKSTATVQGFVILATWLQQSTTYETDNAYLYSGIAIRLGVEIGLHRKTVLSYPDNMDPTIRQLYTGEILSRERTWFCVFVQDRSMSVLTGKPPQAPETYCIRDVDNWWRRPEALLSDVFVAAHAQLLRLLYRCFDVIYSSNDTVTGTSMGLNYIVVIRDLQWRLDEWAGIWTENLRSFHHEHGDKGPLELYIATLRMFHSFYYLIPLSFGLQNCTVDGFNRVDQICFVTRCYERAFSTLEVANRELAPIEGLKTAPDVCIFAVAYAACLLLKLIGPEFRHLFSEVKVLNLVQETATLLEKVSEDDRHLHFLYSLFLRRHLTVHQSTSQSPESTGRSHQDRPEPSAPPMQNFIIGNPFGDLRSTDISIDLDGSLNFTSAANGDTEVFRPGDAMDMNSAWIDSVLGLQHRKDDPFSSAMHGIGVDFAF